MTEHPSGAYGTSTPGPLGAAERVWRRHLVEAKCSGCDYCTVASEALDLRRRIDRTLDYPSEIARVAKHNETAMVTLACIKSLETARDEQAVSE